MQQNMKHIIFLILIIFVIGCKKPDDAKYDIIITDTPANLGKLNSKYDDYNSDLPYPHQRMDIFFSSNRNSKGNNFDIVAGKMDFSYHSEENILNVNIPDDEAPSPSKLIFPKINSTKDEFGPYTYYSGNDLIFMYATSLNDIFSINFVEYTNWNFSNNNNVSNSIKIAKINDLGDNLYPSIDFGNKELYFCSNRNSNVFNIYTAKYSSEINKQLLISENNIEINKNTILSSVYNDKCPYVKDSVIVFTSTRDGGFGGYDLWYSIYKDNSWGSPVNFGNKINSEYDEYRPVFFQVIGFDLMIFSSNRPGMGGFDLYIVKISISKT